LVQLVLRTRKCLIPTRLPFDLLKHLLANLILQLVGKLGRFSNAFVRSLVIPCTSFRRRPVRSGPTTSSALQFAAPSPISPQPLPDPGSPWHPGSGRYFLSPVTATCSFS
jgi:hypothetical protein